MTLRGSEVETQEVRQESASVRQTQQEEIERERSDGTGCFAVSVRSQTAESLSGRGGKKRSSPSYKSGKEWEVLASC